MHEIADRLSELYRAKKDVQVRLAHTDDDYAARLLALTPRPDGWPGKNAEQRELAQATAEDADLALRALRQVRSELRDQLAHTETEIDALIERRDAQRWAIRERMARALEGHGQQYSAVDEMLDEPLTSFNDEELRDTFLGEELDDDLPF